jgi:CHAD domain-containing protein
VTVIQARDRLADATANAIVMAQPTFRLRPGEPLGPGLKRLGVAAIDEAISGFYEGEEMFREAVHITRKSTKRIRAMLRLVRYEVGEQVYRYENAWMRDTARLLSEVRSSSVMVQGVSDIREMYEPLLAEGTFDEVLERTTVYRDRTEERVMEDPEIVPRIVSNLERARGRYESWPTDPDAKSVYGIGIRNDYRAIGPGLETTHARGRHQMVAAYRAPGPASFHRWRKRVKYLRHQMEILTPMWPEVMIGMAVTLDRISELLGQDHDLAELLQALADRPDLCPNPLERSLMNALAEQRRSDLQTACRILGRRIYAETPSAFTKRLGAYWESMELARTTVLVSLSA